MFTTKTQAPQIHHLLEVKSLLLEHIHYIFDKAQYFVDHEICQHKISNALQGQIIMNLFFESSTRTQASFDIASTRLNATVLNPRISDLSLLKGESLIDTINNFEAMGVSLFIIRHFENNKPAYIASELKTDAHIINAGDGTNQHPTQCLIDLFTLNQHVNDFSSLSVAFIGDIKHSRVAHSLIDGLTIMGCTSIHVIAPDELCPPAENYENVTTFTSVEEGVKDVDVIVCLRIQKERISADNIPDFDLFFKEYGLTNERLALAKPNAIVMHPGPINRGVEITSRVADCEQSVILQQAQNSVAVRMALLDVLLNN